MHREALLHHPERSRILEYMSGIITNLGHKSIIINGMADHVHLFIGLNPNLSISDTVKEIKRSSALFINEQKIFPGKFQWQNEYGGFSYSHSHIDRVYNYILHQQEHQRKKTFREEYKEFLNKYQVEFQDQYLFEFFE